MKKLIGAVLMLSMVYVLLATTGNQMFAGSVTVGLGLFSAAMHIHGMTNMAFTGVVIPDFTAKSFEEVEELSDKELFEYKLEEQKFNAATIEKGLEDRIAELKAEENEENEDKLTKMQSTMDALVKENIAFGLKMAKITDVSGNNFEKAVTMATELKANMDAIKSISKGGNGEFVVKADVVRSDIANNTQAQDVSGIGQLASRKLTMYDLFPKVQMGANNNGTIRYWDWDSATTVRAAEMRAENTTFPESTAKWQEYTLTLKKIGDTLPVSAEFFEDEAMFAAELNLFLITNVALILDYQIARGSGTGTNMSGLQTNATAFSPGTVTHMETPTIYDLIEVMDEQITKGSGGKYNPDTCLMNKSTINKMRLSKDANENYILPPFVGRDGRDVGGKIVVESNVYEDDVILVGDRRYGKIYEKGGIMLSRGEVDAQFVEDMETLKVRKRAAFLLRNADVAAWVVTTDVDAALAAIDATS